MCSFECVYCQFVGVPDDSPRRRWPTPGDVRSALANALPRAGPLDSITISGHGEPTLHPHFPRVVAEILAARRRRPDVPVRILTNGAHAAQPGVRHALCQLDECIVSFDAEPEAVNRPGPKGAGAPALRHEGGPSLRGLTAQACFIDGERSNLGRDAVERWAAALAQAKPAKVQIYTIDRRPGVEGVRPASDAQLEGIARALCDRTGIEAQVFAAEPEPDA